MINRASITEAYMEMLRTALEGNTFMQVTKVYDPIVRGVVNVDEKIQAAYESFTFSDGRTGDFWIKNRIEALLEENGEYWVPMRREGQLDYVLVALKGMKEETVARWNANRLLITLFDPSKDLHTSRAPMPPCLISIGLYPVRNELTMIATFRAQYTDIKGYGNLLSLAMLLKQICEYTGFRPRALYSIAQKAIFRDKKKVAKALRLELLKATKK